MNVPFYLEELMRRISLDQRVKITTTTNTYENDDTYLWIPLPDSNVHCPAPAF